MTSFAIYDYETSGTSYLWDRPVQFAGIRTDTNFNPIGEPVNLFCRLPPDILMHPRAALVHGLTPQFLERGLPEPEFAAQILDFFKGRGTIKSGYNTSRFDLHFTRHLLYRCLISPYENEYRDGHTQFDILNLILGVHTLHPSALEWPRKPDGKVSFKLGEVCEANGIQSDNAHDALSDVRMTAKLAQCVQEQAPETFQFFLEHRTKKQAVKLLQLNAPLAKRFIAHVDWIHGAESNYVAPLVPVCRHPSNDNEILCIDLRQDPSVLGAMPPGQLRSLMYCKQEALPAGVTRPPIVRLTLNRAPILIPAHRFTEPVFEANRIDRAACQRHFRQLMGLRDLETLLRSVADLDEGRTEEDVEAQLYFGAGFVKDGDLALLAQARDEGSQALARVALLLEDPRSRELLLRYRGRYFPETLSRQEKAAWHQVMRARLRGEGAPGPLSLRGFWQELQECADELSGQASLRDQEVVRALWNYGLAQERRLASLESPQEIR